MKKSLLLFVLVGLFSFTLPGGAFAAQNAWTTLGPPSGNTLCVAASPAYAGDHTLFAGGNFFGPAGIFKSTSGGAAWNAVVSGVDVDAQVHALAISPAYASDHTVFAATAMGVLRSKSGGASWSPVDTGFPGYPDFPLGGGLNSFNIDAVAISPGYATDHTVYIAGSFFGGPGIFKSDTGGEDWTDIYGALPMGLPGDPEFQTRVRSIAISPAYASDHTVFVATNGGVFRSTSIPVSWSEADTGFPGYPDWPLGGGLNSFDIRAVAMSPAFATDHTVFAGGNFFGGPGIMKSSSVQTKWTDSGAGLPPDFYARALAVSPAYASDHTVFVGTDTGVYVSTTGGASWNSISTGLGDVPIYSIAVSPAYATDHVFFAAGNAVHSISLALPNANGTPSTPASISKLRHGRSFTVSGFLIRHSSGTSPVTLQFYRYQSRHWVLRKSTTAKASNVQFFSKYSDSTSAPYSGKWRVRARHKVGSTYRYSGYRSFTAS